jgi:hypothetical protein
MGDAEAAAEAVTEAVTEAAEVEVEVATDKLKQDIRTKLEYIKNKINNDVFKTWVYDTNLNPLLLDDGQSGINNDILSNGLADIIEEEIIEEEPTSSSGGKKPRSRQKSIEQYLALIPMLSSYINNVYEFMNTVKTMGGGAYEQHMDTSTSNKEIDLLLDYFDVNKNNLEKMQEIFAKTSPPEDDESSRMEAEEDDAINEKEALILMKKSYEKINSKLGEIISSNEEVENIYYYTLEQNKINKRIGELKLNLELEQLNDEPSGTEEITDDEPSGTEEIEENLKKYITENKKDDDTEKVYPIMLTIFESIKKYLNDYDSRIYNTGNIELNLEQLEALVHLCEIILKEQYITTITEYIKYKYYENYNTNPPPFFDFVIPIMITYRKSKLKYPDKLSELLQRDYNTNNKETETLVNNLLNAQKDIIQMKQTLYKHLKYHQYYKRQEINIGTHKPEIFIPLIVATGDGLSAPAPSPPQNTKMELGDGTPPPPPNAPNAKRGRGAGTPSLPPNATNAKRGRRNPVTPPYIPRVIPFTKIIMNKIGPERESWSRAAGWRKRLEPYNWDTAGRRKRLGRYNRDTAGAAEGGGVKKTRKKSKSSQLRKTIKKRRVKKIKRKSLRRRKPIKKRVNSKNRKVKRKIKNKTKKYKKPRKQKRSRKPKP